MDKLRLGVSACLLGERVRYDGNHKLDVVVRDTLGQLAEYVPVCPEVECGLPVPREPMQLVGDPAAPRLVTLGAVDLTDAMQRWLAVRLDELEAENLDGFICKSRSPSCGLEGVRIYDEKGRPSCHGAGLFASALARRLPWLPLVEEAHLVDPAERERFIECARAVHCRAAGDPRQRRL